MVKLAVPSIVAQLINALYNIVDRIYIGHMGADGSLALTGVGVCFPILMVISAFSAFVGMGGGPRASIAMGQKNMEGAERILSNCFTLLLGISIVLTAVLLPLREPLLLSFGASQDTLPYAESYLAIYLCGTVFVQMSLGMNTFITVQGRATISMLTVLIGAVINIGLDPLFIYTFGMGVQGAALATVISQACSAFWVLKFLFSSEASLNLSRKYLKFSPAITMSILGLGISPFIMASTESLVGFVLNGSLKQFGDIYVSSLTILQSAMQFGSVPITGFAQGFVPVASYNYGHGNTARVRECFRISLVTMFSFNAAVMLFLIIFPDRVASMFTSDSQLKATVSQMMPIFLSGMTIFGLQRACQNTFVALGQAKISLFIALLRKVILLVPLALFLPRFWGVKGVFAAESIADATAAICCTVIFMISFPKILKKVSSPSS